MRTYEESESQLFILVNVFPVCNSGKTIELDDVTFHQCVNLTRFNTEKTVSFVPPDGEFELMKYRITDGINLPFRVLPSIKELGRTRMEVNVKVCDNPYYV
jgi:AP-2 complex subunit mu-1